jgi:hypothetical protein
MRKRTIGHSCVAAGVLFFFLPFLFPADFAPQFGPDYLVLSAILFVCASATTTYWWMAGVIPPSFFLYLVGTGIR